MIQNKRGRTPLILATFFIALFCTLISYFVAGSSLDLFIAGFLFATILIPFTRVAHFSDRQALTIAVATALIWLIPLFKHIITPTQLLHCTLVLFTFTIALQNYQNLLLTMRLHSPIASALSTTTALAWVTWPIYLSPYLVNANPAWLIKLSPLFALNGQLPQLGIWTEQQIAYHLTNLGQDTPYQLPRSTIPTLLLHAALATIFYATARLAGGHARRSRPTTSPPA